MSGDTHPLPPSTSRHCMHRDNFAIFMHHRKIAKKQLLASSCLSVCLSVSVRMEQLGSHWTDFQAIRYLRIFRKLVTKIQYLAEFLIEQEMFQKKVEEKMKTHFMFSNLFLENRVVYEIMWKNTVQPDRPQMTI
jgi:hypothetical protein